MKKRERDEQLARQYGRGRIIERLDYKKLKCLAYVDLQQYLKELNGEQHQQAPFAELTTTSTSKGQQCPYCPHCKEKLQSIVLVHDEPTEVNLTLSLVLNETMT